MQLATNSPNQGQAERIPGMVNRRGGLLAQIEADLIDDRPLSSLMQKCIEDYAKLLVEMIKKVCDLRQRAGVSVVAGGFA
jgi:hypothetical protein